MGFLSDIQHDDAQFGFFSTDEHAEAVTFRPWNGATRTINVIVNRDVDPTDDEQATGVREVMLVNVESHATRGILVTALNANKDKIDLSYRPGETAKTYMLGMPISVDANSLTFRVY